MLTQLHYELLLARYGEEKYFPPMPNITLEEIRNDSKSFWKAFQKAFEHFFYSDFIVEGREMAAQQGVEYTWEFYEELFNLGMFQFSMTDDDPFRGKFVSLLYWNGAYYKEQGRL